MSAYIRPLSIIETICLGSHVCFSEWCLVLILTSSVLMAVRNGHGDKEMEGFCVIKVSRFSQMKTIYNMHETHHGSITIPSIYSVCGPEQSQNNSRTEDQWLIMEVLPLIFTITADTILVGLVDL